MMSQHNVGDTQKLKLPEPSRATFDATGSGFVNIMDSSRVLSPDTGTGGASSSGQQSTTNVAGANNELLARQRNDSNCSFAEKLYAAVADGAANGTADANDAEIDEQIQEEQEQKEELGEMLNLLTEGSVQSGSTGRSPDLNAVTTPASPHDGQAMSLKSQRTRHMSKKQKEVLEIINQFQVKVKKPVLHVYWLFDDGGKSI